MKSQTKKSLKFSVTIAVITFVLAAIFAVISESVLSNVVWILGLFIVFIIVFVGVVFDMLGIAATSATEKPFHAMAAEKVNGAKEAVNITRNADKFASFCNDVIGDISGVVSGTASATVVLQIAHIFGEGDGSSLQIVLSVVLTSLVAALTVGGKAIGKFAAINFSTDLIFFAGKIIAFIEKNFKISIFPKEDKKTNR
ncbi:hypothetical protein SAMN05216238_10283 [Lentibacillus persicus]|uniref:CNNM transmembrane domain-containing protein n=1 Tax=Lentibacillus persicus TaxID=640948 RepID=A0A1I1T2A1_9BACI|nr:hypothetical protein [Lentibacillus persicus]SFD52797.1 hypothetical protein SAMN05216238_10283 [Lentibacillus persicus]